MVIQEFIGNVGFNPGTKTSLRHRNEPGPERAKKEIEK